MAANLTVNQEARVRFPETPHSITMNWEDIKFPPINLWSAPRLSQDSPSPEEHSLMVKRRDLLTVKYDKLESDRNRQEQHPWEA